VTDASKFLQSWVQENVNATVYDDKQAAEHLADLCLRATKHQNNLSEGDFSRWRRSESLYAHRAEPRR